GFRRRCRLRRRRRLSHPRCGGLGGGNRRRLGDRRGRRGGGDPWLPSLRRPGLGGLGPLGWRLRSGRDLVDEPRSTPVALDRRVLDLLGAVRAGLHRRPPSLLVPSPGGPLPSRSRQTRKRTPRPRPEGNRGQPAGRSTPPFITASTSVSRPTSLSTSPRTATRSANSPGSIAPTRSRQARSSAATTVAERIASIGVIPCLTMVANWCAFIP